MDDKLILKRIEEMISRSKTGSVSIDSLGLSLKMPLHNLVTLVYILAEEGHILIEERPSPDKKNIIPIWRQSD